MSKQPKNAADNVKAALDHATEVLATDSRPTEASGRTAKPLDRQQDQRESLTFYDLETGLIDAVTEYQDALDEHEAACLEAGQELPMPPELLQLLNHLQEVVAAYANGALDKRDAIARYYRHLRAKEDALAAELQRLHALRRSTKRKHERLAQSVIEVLKSLRVKRLEGNAFVLRMQRNPASVEVVDESKVPSKWRKDPQPPPPDVDKIKQHLMAMVNKALQAYGADAEDLDKEYYGELLIRAGQELGIKLELVPGCLLITDKYHLRTQ